MLKALLKESQNNKQSHPLHCAETRSKEEQDDPSESTRKERERDKQRRDRKGERKRKREQERERDMDTEKHREPLETWIEREEEWQRGRERESERVLKRDGKTEAMKRKKGVTLKSARTQTNNASHMQLEQASGFQSTPQHARICNSNKPHVFEARLCNSKQGWTSCCNVVFWKC